MGQADDKVTVRGMKREDLLFIQSLSGILAAGAKFTWHSEAVVQEFQDDYIADMMAATHVRHITLIAEKNGKALGFVHARERKDEISGESCSTVPLLAVEAAAQGAGVGKLLMQEVEVWSKAQGFRLLHLEVFSTNQSARTFYQNIGFQPETINMMKQLD